MAAIPTKPLPLHTVEHLTDGQTIGMIQGSLSQFWTEKRGNNPTKPWSLQNGTISGDGVEVPIVFMDFPEQLPMALKGRTIRITAGTTRGLTGIYAHDDTFRDKTTRKIKITPSALIELIGGDGSITLVRGEGSVPEPSQAHKDLQTIAAAEYAEPEPRQQQRPAATTRQQRQPEPEPEPGPDLSGPTPRAEQKTDEEIAAEKARAEQKEIREARHSMIQVANLQLMSRLCVENYVAKTFKGVSGNEMTESEKQGATASIFIQLTKTGAHQKMPKRPFTVDELKK